MLKPYLSQMPVHVIFCKHFSSLLLLKILLNIDSSKNLTIHLALTFFFFFFFFCKNTEYWDILDNRWQIIFAYDYYDKNIA